MIFEPSPAFAEPYETDMSGMTLAAAPGQPVSVEYVVSGGPAANAGIAPGDTLLSVDGRRADAESLDDIRATFTTDGARRRLTLRRGATTREVVLTLHRLI